MQRTWTYSGSELGTCPLSLWLCTACLPWCCMLLSWPLGMHRTLMPAACISYRLRGPVRLGGLSNLRSLRLPPRWTFIPCLLRTGCQTSQLLNSCAYTPGVGCEDKRLTVGRHEDDVGAAVILDSALGIYAMHVAKECHDLDRWHLHS